MPAGTVLVEERGEVASITLNRPDKGNAVDTQIIGQLIQILKALSEKDSIRVLQIRGAGADFCLGRVPSPNFGKGSAYDTREEIQQIAIFNDLWWNFNGITMAVVRGRALGFGAGLALQSDFALASDDARFGFPEIKAGLTPTVVLSYIRRWVPRKRAFDLIVTGEEISAQEAERLGMVNRVLPAAELEAEVERLTRLLLAQKALSLATCKQFFREIEGMSVADATRYGVNLLANILSKR